MTPAQSAGLEQRARELLAREYEREYMRLGADDVRIAERLNLLEDRMAVRAIVAALAAAPAASAVEALARAVEGVMPHSYERGVAARYVGRGWTQLSAALAHPEIAALLKETK